MRLSPKESVICSLLAEQRDLYGLELVERSAGVLKRGTVYVTLARMIEKGLVATRQDQGKEDHPGLPRPRYRLTALGFRAVDAERAFNRAMGEVTG